MNSDKQPVQFSPVETKRASQLVFEHLRSLILQGILRPGDELPSERQMMQQFRRSHPTIREALRMLEAAGLIEVLPGNATIVCTLDDNPVQKPLDELFRYQEVSKAEVVEFMASIEPDFVALAAVRRSNEDLLDLETACKELKEKEQIVIGDIIPFHEIMMRSCHNPLITVVWEALGKILIAGQKTEEDSRVNQDISDQIKSRHQQLLTSIRRQDPAQASKEAAMCWNEWKGIQGKLTVDDIHTSGDTLSIKNEQVFAPIRTEKVSEAVYRQIKEKILSGELLPGDKLPPERKLMEMFSRSRPTIREALRMLESNHLIRTMPGSGTVVNVISTQSAERSLLDLIERKRVRHADLREFRNICETVIVSWAARRRCEEDIQKLESIISRVESFVNRIEESMAMGHRFNLALAQASQNKAAYVVIRAVSEVNYSLVKKNWQNASSHLSAADMLEHSRKIWRQHEKIFIAVRDGDPTAARQATIVHIAESNKAAD